MVAISQETLTEHKVAKEVFSCKTWQKKVDDGRRKLEVFHLLTLRSFSNVNTVVEKTQSFQQRNNSVHTQGKRLESNVQLLKWERLFYRHGHITHNIVQKHEREKSKNW